MASTKLQRTFTTDHGNVYKWTYSFWVKRSKISSGDHAITAVTYSGAYQSRISFKSDDKLEIYDYRNNSYILQKKTNRKFRDTSAWYHIVVSNDNTQASADDRTKIYINGVQETSFGTNNQYSQNQKTSFNDDYPNYIGSYGSGDYFDGSMSHFHFIDGTAYAPTEFGETDSTTGEWKIKTNVSVTYGTNGFFILKDGNSVTDQSGNSNNFTVGGGTLTKTEDNPSNVFATLNPLSSSATLTTGNTTGATADSTWRPASTTIGMLGTTGKYYAEFKVISGNNNYVGVYNLNTNFGTSQSTADANRIAYSTYDGEIMRTLTGESTISGLATSGSSDVVGIAINKNDGEVKFYKNGTLIQTVSHSNITNYDLMIGCQLGYTSSSCFNFGNGYFGTTAISSAGSNGNGSLFEYDVPSGYYALNTKNINTYG